MILVLYDISNTKTQTKLRRYLRRYGIPLQYSVYQIFAADFKLRRITQTIEQDFVPFLQGSDSIIIVPLSESQLSKCRVYGNNAFDNEDYIEI